MIPYRSFAPKCPITQSPRANSWCYLVAIGIGASSVPAAAQSIVSPAAEVALPKPVSTSASAPHGSMVAKPQGAPNVVASYHDHPRRPAAPVMLEAGPVGVHERTAQVLRSGPSPREIRRPQRLRSNPSATLEGYVDRIEGQWAVVVDAFGAEHAIPCPQAGCPHEGASWPVFEAISVDVPRQQRAQRVKDLLDRLRLRDALHAKSFKMQGK